MSCLYTINIYRTTSTVMVNGPHHLTFVNNDLPVITEVIDKMNNSIRMISSRVKQTLSSSISICEAKSERNTVASEKGCSRNQEARSRKCMPSEPSENELYSPPQTNDGEQDSEIELSEDVSDQSQSDEESDFADVPGYPQTLSGGTAQQTEETSSAQLDVDSDADNLVQCVCNQIDTEKMMECGDCKKWTHYECTQLPLYMLKQLCNNKLRKYQCRTCISTNEDDARLFNVHLPESQSLVDKPRIDTTDRSSQTLSDMWDKLTAKKNSAEQENVSLNIRLQTTLDELKKLQVTNNLQKNLISTKEEEVNTLKGNLDQTQRDLANKMKGH